MGHSGQLRSWVKKVIRNRTNFAFLVMIGIICLGPYKSAFGPLAVLGSDGHCRVSSLSVEEREAAIGAAAQDTRPTSGAFPDPTDILSGSAYTVTLNVDGSILSVYLDGSKWVVGGQAAQTRIPEFNPLPFDDLLGVIDTLGELRLCAQTVGGAGIEEYLTDFGIQWVFGEDDPFNVSSSPFSQLLLTGDATASTPSVYRLLEARQLSDGRAVVLLTDGDDPYDDEIGPPIVETSIVVLRYQDRLWSIDAVIGGISIWDPPYLEV